MSNENTASKGVGSSGWLGQNELKAGYYWCRLGDDDTAPTIVKIDDEQSPEELALWEFKCGEWQSVVAYGPPWQFLPVDCHNTASHAPERSGGCV